MKKNQQPTRTRKVFIDQKAPGVLRFIDDPMAGFIVGISAPEIARAINSYDMLIETIRTMMFCEPHKLQYIGERAIRSAETQS